MITTTYGYLKPENTDTGDVIFPALATDIQKLNDHNHDGTNSAPLASKGVNILAVGWALAPIAGGLYRQSVNLPTGFMYSQCEIWFKLSTGEVVYPSVEKINETSFYVYTNDNTLQYAAYFR